MHLNLLAWVLLVLGALDIASSDAHSTRRRRPILARALHIPANDIGAQKLDIPIENTYIVIEGNYPA
jgi:tyrosine-protein phosphatase YwqE